MPMKLQLFKKIKEILQVVRHRKHYINPSRSYYPECPSKSNFEVFKDQVGHILRYGYKNTDYYVMGVDVKGENWKDYVPERYNVKVLSEANRKWANNRSGFNYVLSLADKWNFAEIMEHNGFPVPPTVGLLHYGNLILPHTQGASADFEALLDGPCDLLFKPVLGRGGQGILPVKIADGAFFVEGKEMGVAQLLELVDDDVFLIQGRVTNQHPAMKALFPKTLNTIRMTMVRTAGGVELLGCMCLMGASDAAYSNWHFGGICTYVDADGRLGKYGFSRSQRRITHHPDTGIAFEGYQLPFFKETIRLCEQAMDVYYGVKTIGWDMAVTEEGPVFIEGNHQWGVIAHQMVEHKGWADKYKKYFNR